MLFLDIESYYDDVVSLRKMSMHRYCCVHQSHLICAAFLDTNDKTNEVEVLWNYDQIYKYLKDRMPCPIVAQNAVFDLLFLSHMFPALPWQECSYLCTLSMAQHLFHRSSLDLDSIAKLVRSGKSEDTSFFKGMNRIDILADSSIKDRMDTYVVQDVHVTYALFKMLIKEIPRCHLETIHWAINRFVHPRLVLDDMKVIACNRQLMVERQTLLHKAEVDDSALLSSRTKFAQLVRDRGFVMPMKPSPSNKQKLIPQLAKTDPFIMNNLTREGPLGDLVRARVAYSSSIELARSSKWIMNSSVAPYTPYRFHVMPSGTFTHRLAGRGGFGDNPLNQTRDSPLRYCVQAEKGHKLAGFDFTGLELRIARWVAHDQPAIDIVNDGEDIYVHTIASIRGMEPVRTKDGGPIDDILRHIGKEVTLSSQYGVGWNRLKQALYARNVDITEDEARDIVHQFRTKLHPALPRAWSNVEKHFMVDKQGNLKDYLNLPGQPHPDGWRWPSGRVLRYRDMRQVRRLNEDTGHHEYRWSWRPSFNQHRQYTYPSAVFQSFIQSLANEVICTVRDRLREAGFYVAMECYDELVLILKESDDDDEACKVITAIATAPLEWWPEGPPLDIEIKIGDSYGAIH